MNTATSLPIQFGFIFLTLLFWGLLVLEIKKALPKTTFGERRQKRFLFLFILALVIWIAFVSSWSWSGRMGDFSFFPFNIMPVMAIPLLALVAFTISSSTGEVLRHIPAQNLIRLQSFRLFVELLLWSLYVRNEAPVQMTFEGRNFDILSGLSALVIAYLITRQKISRTGLVIWNLICLGLLINILATAILSMPTPIRIFMNEPANTIVAAFPVSWLPGLLVPLAYVLHFLSLRQVLGNKLTATTPDAYK